MGSLDISGNEESHSEQQLRDKLRHLDCCIKAVSSCRSDHNLPPAKRDGVEQLLGFLYRRVAQWRAEILKEQPEYDALLILFGVEKFGSPLPGDISTDEATPYVFRSPWLQVVLLSLQHVGFRAGYKTIANWIADNHPYEPLPSYCNNFKNDPRDIGWLVANRTKVAQAFMRDISRVRNKMAPANVGKRRVV